MVIIHKKITLSTPMFWDNKSHDFFDLFEIKLNDSIIEIIHLEGLHKGSVLQVLNELKNYLLKGISPTLDHLKFYLDLNNFKFNAPKNRTSSIHLGTYTKKLERGNYYKYKIQTSEQAKKLVHYVSNQIDNEFKIIIDSNEFLNIDSYNQINSTLKEISKSIIYWEDPVPLDLISQLRFEDIPYALDQNIVKISEDKKLIEYFEYFIIKPSLIGSISEIRALANSLAIKSKKVVLSHNFEDEKYIEKFAGICEEASAFLSADLKHNLRQEETVLSIIKI